MPKRLLNDAPFERYSSSGELLTRTYASTQCRTSLYTISAVSSAQYVCLVDLSDVVNFPHKVANYIDIDMYELSVKFASNTANAPIKIGVITRIDGTNADISYLISNLPSVQSSNEGVIISRNFQPSDISFRVVSGKLVTGVTNDKETNLTAVNTGITLPTPIGTTTPAVGDIIVKFGYVADQYDAVVTVLYHAR